jgi:hypothetical protein
VAADNGIGIQAQERDYIQRIQLFFLLGSRFCSKESSAIDKI